ncbi:toll/interleukin-1 receptor domain-containing protein [Xanthobacter autotrophicus]|uniref:toll/interleukin-1 receptor domain-containing protein n=1 Tax=Xanthobacter autotrophicus TaxID=280 RepID=UPI0037266E29
MGGERLAGEVERGLPGFNVSLSCPQSALGVGKSNMKKRVFISYSHDSQEHKSWVLGLAIFLRENGIDVKLDQWDVGIGEDLPKFMEDSIRDSDRVIVISTDKYIEKANSGSGGVGYEKIIVSSEMFSSFNNRRKFIPIVRGVNGNNKLPTFFGSALYLDLTGDLDESVARKRLVDTIFEILPQKPVLGRVPFVPDNGYDVENASEKAAKVGLFDPDVEFDRRFSSAFPGLRGREWVENSEKIKERLSILFRDPIISGGAHLAWWFRGHSNMHIFRFRHVEDRNFLMNEDEINISRICAVNIDVPTRKFIYVETNPDIATGVYGHTEDDIQKMKDVFGYAYEEFGLVDGRLPITRAEYDDGAAIVNGVPVDVTGRVELRVRYLSPYNFIIAPHNSPINQTKFDEKLNEYLNEILNGKNLFDEMCDDILSLRKRGH